MKFRHTLKFVCDRTEGNPHCRGRVVSRPVISGDHCSGTRDWSVAGCTRCSAQRPASRNPSSSVRRPASHPCRSTTLPKMRPTGGWPWPAGDGAEVSEAKGPLAKARADALQVLRFVLFLCMLPFWTQATHQTPHPNSFCDNGCWGVASVVG